MTKGWTNCLGITLLLGLSGSVHAGSLSDDFDSTWSLRNDMWSGTHQLNDDKDIDQISLWGQGKLQMEEAGTLVFNGWLREQTHNDDGVPPPSPDYRIRDLYWRFNVDPLQVTIGRQTITWGRADGINPTDNISPRDFTLLAPDDADQRYGNDGVALKTDVAAGTLSLVWLARAASDTIPLQAIPNVAYIANPSVRKPQWAAKWDMSGDAIDGSLSYFHGIDHMPDLVFGGAAPGAVNIALVNHSAQVFGGDFSLSRNGVIWRGEAAWMQTDSTGRSDFDHKKSQLWWAAGGEWALPDSTTLGLQVTMKKVMNFESPDDIAQPILRQIAWLEADSSNQTFAFQSGMTWRLARRWLNDTLTAEINGIAWWPSGDGAWRTKLTYAVDDHWSLQAGTESYFGPAHSYFGELRKNNLFYAQVRYGW